MPPTSTTTTPRVSTHGGDLGKLAEAVCAVMAEVRGVPKTGYNSEQKYKFASDEDVLMAVQPAMAAHGLALIPTGAEAVTVDAGQTKSGSQWWRTDVIATYLLVHTGGGWVRVQSAGSGRDTSDKAVYKALTGALKYAHRGVFALPVGHDPETDVGEQDAPRRRTREQIAADKAAKEAADRARQAEHDPSFAADRARFAAQCNEIGVPYEVVADWCEAHERPRPSHMTQERRDKLLAWLPEHVADIVEWSAMRGGA